MTNYTAWRFRLSQAFWDGMDWLYPPVCGGCGKQGTRWCDVCRANLTPVPEPLCEICGLPQPQPGICCDCLSLRPPFQALRSWAVFDGPMRKVIHSLKYGKNYGGLGVALVSDLARFYQSLGWKVDLVVSVPLSVQRLKQRGYNQVEQVARPLADLLGLRYQPGALKKVRDTETQVGKNRLARQANVRNAFYGNSDIVKGRIVLLMDDVATTGSTLFSAASALKKAGAAQVFALTLARALPHHGLHIV